MARSRPVVSSRTSPGGAARRLRRYRQKRNLDNSGEPTGGGEEKTDTEPLRFVIQKHDATRLHYDLRLEMNGVFKSWAVPKGLPEKVGARSLAIEVEDHPLAYGGFEGVIPEGNYGAGTVMLWDRGAYAVEGGEPERAFRRGSIHFALVGTKCKGAWTLVRMRKGDEEKTSWLLIKNHDRRPGAAVKRTGRDRSVATGRRMDEIAAGGAQQKQDRHVRPKRAPRKPATASPAAAAADYVEPMKALASRKVPAGDWVYEVKFDGYRALALLRDGEAGLWSRNKKPLSDKYPEIVSALKKLKCRRAVLDGEVVALDPRGRPRFQLLQRLDGPPAERPPLFYYVFDLLRRNGVSLLGQPLEKRRAGLEKLLRSAPDEIRFSGALKGEPRRLLEHVRSQGLEGIVAKAKGSAYEPGRRSGAWIKCRVASDQEFVIGGFTPPRGARAFFGAVLVGYYEGDNLLYAGKVGTGFDAKILASLHGLFARLTQKPCPFSNLPMSRKPRFGQGMTATEMRKVTWLKPKLVCQVRFSEWTHDGLLRQPVFLGLREDKDAGEVTRELSV